MTTAQYAIRMANATLPASAKFYYGESKYCRRTTRSTN